MVVMEQDFEVELFLPITYSVRAGNPTAARVLALARFAKEQPVEHREDRSVGLPFGIVVKEVASGEGLRTTENESVKE